MDPAILPTGARLATDAAGKTVILFQDEWSCNFFAERNPSIRMFMLPAEAQVQAAEATA